MRFSEYMIEVAGQIDTEMGHAEHVVDTSLELFSSVAALCDVYRRDREGCTGSDIRRVLEPATKLFCLANQGNTIDEPTIEGHFLWNGGGNEGFTIEALMTLCHLVAKNLRNVSSGVLERSSFYPIFSTLAQVAGGYGLKLSDL